MIVGLDLRYADAHHGDADFRFRQLGGDDLRASAVDKGLDAGHRTYGHFLRGQSADRSGGLSSAVAGDTKRNHFADTHRVVAIREGAVGAYQPGSRES